MLVFILVVTNQMELTREMKKGFCLLFYFIFLDTIDWPDCSDLRGLIIYIFNSIEYFNFVLVWASGK